MEVSDTAFVPVFLPNKQLEEPDRVPDSDKVVLKATGLNERANTPTITESSLPIAFSGDIRQYTASQPLQDGEEGEESSLTDDQLTPEEEEQVAKLKQRDAEVRAHEQAHLAAAGSLATGGIQYQYQTGPDGKQYAIGGSVQLDTSEEKSPEATIQKAQQIRRAALAPADPSPQDVKVASQALQMEAEARREITEQSQEVEDDKENLPEDVVTDIQGLTGQSSSV